MRRALLIAVLVALALPAGAAAHALPSSVFPNQGQRLQQSPRQVVVTFDEPLLPQGMLFQVFSASGRDFATGKTILSDGDRRVTVPLKPLTPGGYTIRWRVASADDGHIPTGLFTFGFRAPAPPLTAAFGAGGAAFWDKLIRWGLLASMMLMIGGIGFRLAVVQRDSNPLYEQRFYRSVGLGIVLALELGLIGFLRRSNDILQLRFTRFWYADLGPFAGSTSFGHAFKYMTLGFAGVMVFVVLAWLLDRGWLLWPGLGLGLAAAIGLPFSSHSASYGHPVWATELADWVHLAAACIWLGGLIQLTLCVWPGADEETKRRSFLRFSVLAEAAIVAIIAGGVYLALTRLAAVSDLWNTHYGRVLFLKLGIVAAVLALGAFHHMLVRPRLLARSPEGTRHLGRSLALETTLGLAVVGVTAVLVNTQPPAPTSRTIATPPVQTVSPDRARSTLAFELRR